MPFSSIVGKVSCFHCFTITRLGKMSNGFSILFSIAEAEGLLQLGEKVLSSICFSEEGLQAVVSFGDSVIERSVQRKEPRHFCPGSTGNERIIWGVWLEVHTICSFLLRVKISFLFATVLHFRLPTLRERTWFGNPWSPKRTRHQ